MQNWSQFDSYKKEIIQFHWLQVTRYNKNICNEKYFIHFQNLKFLETFRFLHCWKEYSIHWPSLKHSDAEICGLCCLQYRCVSALKLNVII